MRRLEFSGFRRSAAGRSRTSAEAVLVLAQIARERCRLDQERSGLEKRLRGIERRLTQLADAETRLAPAIQLQLDRMNAAGALRPTQAGALPAGIGEVTLQY